MLDFSNLHTLQDSTIPPASFNFSNIIKLSKADSSKLYRIAYNHDFVQYNNKIHQIYSKSDNTYLLECEKQDRFNNIPIHTNTIEKIKDEIIFSITYEKRTITVVGPFGYEVSRPLSNKSFILLALESAIAALLNDSKRLIEKYKALSCVHHNDGGYHFTPSGLFDIFQNGLEFVWDNKGNITAVKLFI